MGACLSAIKSLQILKVSEDSVSHKNGILPFIHSIVSFNGKAIESKDDALTMNKEWESKALQLELIDMRTMETSILEIPRKDKTRLGISVKFHQSIACLLSMEVLRVNPESPAEKAGMVVGDYILGIENIYSKDEEDLLRFLEMNRRRVVPLLVYNSDLEYVRVVSLQVGVDVLLGCQIGMGELYKVPFSQRRCKVEFNSEIIRNDVRRLRRKLRGRDIISSRLKDVVCGSDSHSESVSSTYAWDVQEKTPAYNLMSPSLRKPSCDESFPDVSSDSQPLEIPLLDIEDVNEIPVILPESLTYEVPIDKQERAKTERDGVSKSIVNILEQEQDDHFDFENSLPLANKGVGQKKELQKLGTTKRTEDPESRHQVEDRDVEEPETFFLPIEKSDTHRDEFDAKNFLSSLSLSFYGTENEHDSGTHRAVTTSVHESNGECPLCFKHHREEHDRSSESSGEYTPLASKTSSSLSSITSSDAGISDEEEAGEIGRISLGAPGDLLSEKKATVPLGRLRIMGDLGGDHPHSEENSLESTSIGSPPYSDPGSIL
ncbi:peripheral Golgi membrane protein [Encephalitozoon cuniculi EcunIII-L]|nr:peripheral Golgi membrane protein [Encephalitozoon cuniculi EcunIII-L]